MGEEVATTRDISAKDRERSLGGDVLVEVWVRGCVACVCTARMRGGAIAMSIGSANCMRVAQCVHYTRNMYRRVIYVLCIDVLYIY